MIKKIRSPFLIIALLCAMLLAPAIHLGVAFAYESCTGTIDLGGGLNAQACKDAWVTSGGGYWTGRMISKVLSGTSISQIGWTYWNNTRYCGTTSVGGDSRGSSYGYNLPNWMASSPSYHVGSCSSGDNNAIVSGNHYFKNGSTVKQADTFKPIDLPG
jgi:hypothetical protein